MSALSALASRALAVQGAGFGPLPFATLGVIALPPRGHSLDVRGIAVQGLGFDPRLAGLQGLWPPSVEPPIVFPGTGRSRIRRERQRRDSDDDVLFFLLR